MRCSKCGKVINSLNHYYVPTTNGTQGKRYCLNCARKENIITLV